MVLATYILVIVFSLFSKNECFIRNGRENNENPTYIESEVGTHAILNCQLDFPQDIVIPYILRWKKDNENVFSWYDGVLSASPNFVGRISLVDYVPGYGKGSVNLTSIRESDSGWYDCKVIFPNRNPNSKNNGTKIHLSVDGGALMKIPPINQTILEGEKSYFNCIMKLPDISFVTWYKDKTLISDLHNLMLRTFIESDGSLAIYPTKMTDLGEYECVVQNRAGERQSAKAYLNVQYKAKVIYAPKEVYFPFGQPATLNCHFRSNPALLSLRWEKDGFLFDSYNVQGVYYKRNGSLYFTKVEESHAGLYSCTPFNELGSDGPSSLIKVIVQRPPVFTIKPSPLYIHKIGDTVSIPCDARDSDNSERRPLIVWTKKDGTSLQSNRILIEAGNITIVNVTRDDRGIYQCSAQNEAATISADTEIMLHNVAPFPPYNLTANSTDSEITLHWQPGYMRPNLEYIIWYRPSNTAEWRTLKAFNSKINLQMATVKNLRPGNEYEFMVLCQDQYGEGMFSKSFRYFTKNTQFNETDDFRSSVLPFSQIGSPQNITVNSTVDGYIVKWLNPIDGINNLRLYRVKWWKDNNDEICAGETSENSFMVPYLEEDEIYNFQVFSISSNNYESGSEIVELYIPPIRKIAITIGTSLIFLTLVLAVFLIFYFKKKCVASKFIKGNDVEKI